jgi:hypothetical protein
MLMIVTKKAESLRVGNALFGKLTFKDRVPDVLRSKHCLARKH